MTENTPFTINTLDNYTALLIVNDAVALDRERYPNFTLSV